MCVFEQSGALFQQHKYLMWSRVEEEEVRGQGSGRRVGWGWVEADKEEGLEEGCWENYVKKKGGGGVHLKKAHYGHYESI